MTSPRLQLLPAGFLIGILACAGSKESVTLTPPPPPPSSPGTSYIAGTISGSAFTSAGGINLGTYGSATKMYIITGGEITGSLRNIYITVSGVTGPGTYTLGLGVPVPEFRYASATINGKVWDTNAAGGSGTVIVTIATATRFAGTFSFTGVPAVGSSGTGTVIVTGGTFDEVITP